MASLALLSVVTFALLLAVLGLAALGHVGGFPIIVAFVTELVVVVLVIKVVVALAAAFGLLLLDWARGPFAATFRLVVVATEPLSTQATAQRVEQRGVSISAIVGRSWGDIANWSRQTDDCVGDVHQTARLGVGLSVVAAFSAHRQDKLGVVVEDVGQEARNLLCEDLLWARGAAQLLLEAVDAARARARASRIAWLRGAAVLLHLLPHRDCKQHVCKRSVGDLALSETKAHFKAAHCTKEMHNNLGVSVRVFFFVCFGSSFTAPVASQAGVRTSWLHGARRTVCKSCETFMLSWPASSASNRDPAIADAICFP